MASRTTEKAVLPVLKTSDPGFEAAFAPRAFFEDVFRLPVFLPDDERALRPTTRKSSSRRSTSTRATAIRTLSPRR